MSRKAPYTHSDGNEFTITGYTKSPDYFPFCRIKAEGLNSPYNFIITFAYPGSTFPSGNIYSLSLLSSGYNLDFAPVVFSAPDTFSGKVYIADNVGYNIYEMPVAEFGTFTQSAN